MKLNPKHLENPAFLDWFQGSKVVDSRGQPMVLFHGTDADVGAFSTEMIGGNFRADDRGFFFINCPKQASNYAENDTVGLNKREGGNVMPVYVNLKNPLVIDDAFLQGPGMAKLGVHEDVVSFWDTYQGLILEWLDERRADGVILVDRSYRIGSEPTTMVVAMKPEQIKSALGNSGHFKKTSRSLSDPLPNPSLIGEKRAKKALRALASSDCVSQLLARECP